MNALLAWIEATGLARAVATSAAFTAWLSAVHVVGFTLVTGSALVANLRGAGAVRAIGSLANVVRSANRAVAIGLAMSVTTGVLLFAARATDAGGNGTFRLKMLLLLAAAAFQLVLAPRIAAREPVDSPGTRTASAVGIGLWLALALVACAFILLE